MRTCVGSVRAAIAALAVLSALHTRAAAQERSAHEPDDAPTLDEQVEARRPLVLEGVVLGPGGAPVAGAVVVTSAGGKAVADAGGGFRLEVELPRGATSVQVTATAARGTNLVASTSVALSAASSSATTGPLFLTAGSACTCAPGWIPTFGAHPGVDDRVQALTVFDDGSGAVLYAAGNFTFAGAVPANRIAKWDGSSWSALGNGLSGSAGTIEVRALAVYDDGGGAALYAGGTFTTAGGAAATGIARWSGSSWSAVGSGVDNFVYSLAVHDDGGGAALYAGGTFTSAGGAPASNIAKWDGVGWSALGSGVNASVRALAVYDDGGGPALHAGGFFTSAGGVAANRIAKWDGSSWSALGGGTDDSVHSLGVFDDGSGAVLYAGGSFTSAGGASASLVARWDGSTWASVGSGLFGPDFPHRAQAFAVFDDGGGPALYTGGLFSLYLSGGTSGISNIGRWDGSSWTALGNGVDGPVEALAVYDDGGGTALYAGGDLKSASGVQLNGIGKWDGTSWSALGSGISPYGAVYALAEFDDGTGAALYAGGAFSSMGGIAANRIASWDGSSWAALGSGVGGPAYERVYALAVFDDGGGPALFAGGSFTSAGGVAAVNLARWNGSSWSSVAPFNGLVTNEVRVLAVYDDGSGEALYVGADFRDAGGFTVHSIARWDGASWSGLGTGPNGSVRALTVFDDGSGPALHVGGDFTTAGGVTVNGVARWNGSSWAALGSGMGGGPVVSWVRALAAYDDGGGPALFAGGHFPTAGGMAVNNVARWDGASWSAVASGTYSYVGALQGWDDGSGPALFASCDAAIDSGDSHLARWSCNLDVAPPTISAPASVLVGDRIGTPPGEVVTFHVTATDCRDPSPVLVCVPPSGSLFPRGKTIVTCTATDAAGNQSTCEFPVIVARGIH